MKKSMTKSELISRLQHKNNQLSLKTVENSVHTILTTITQTLQQGNRVEIRGFGSYQLKLHNPRFSRNPKTGKQFHTTKKMVIRFKPAKALRERVNRGHKKFEIQQ